MNFTWKFAAIIAVMFVNALISGCEDEVAENGLLTEDTKFQEISEMLTHNMDVNKQDAIDEIAPHLDKLTATLAKLCSEIVEIPDLLKECDGRLAEIRTRTEAIKSGNFDSIPRS